MTHHRRLAVRLVPVESEPVVVAPPRNREPSRLADRPRSGLHTLEDTEALLEEMAADR